MDENGYSGRLRKRKRVVGDGSEESLRGLLELSEHCGKMVIFSGSGLSANSGMSMFTTKNGLYERARSKFKIQDGMKLFSYPFYKQRRKDLQAFFAQIYSEAQSSRAAPGHVAIAELHKMGRIQRHYTLNIDGLAAAVGMDTWHHENNPEGSTVEMHGNISYVVCPSCHAVEPLTGKVMETMKACEAVICKACNEDEMRFKVMLYDDEQGDCITPEDVFERLDDDLAVAGAVVWVGISFEQSASTEYFRKVRHMLASHGRLHEVTQVILNPSDEPYFNVMSTMSNKEDVKLLDVRATSDDALPRIVEHLHQLFGTEPDPAAMQAAAEAAKAAAAASRKRKLELEQQLALQQQEQAAAGADEHATPRAAGGRRRRGSGSVVTSPQANAAALADTAGTCSYAELAAIDSAAAAALSVPAAVQKHFAQKQLQLQLQLAGANGVKAEADSAAAAHASPQAVQEQQPVQQQAVHSPAQVVHQQDHHQQQQHEPPLHASEVSAAAAAGGQLGSVPTLTGAQQQGGIQGHFQQLLGQLQAVHALQAAIAAQSAQQQQPPAAVPPPLGISPLLAAAAAAGLQTPALQALAAGSIPPLPGVNPLLAVLGNKQAAAATAAVQPSAPAAQAPHTAAVNGNPLAAAAALLASSPAAASLLLSNPGLLAAAAAAAGGSSSGLANGAATAAAPVAAAQVSPPAAAGCHGQPGFIAAAVDAGGGAHLANGAHAGTAVKSEPEAGVGPANDAAGNMHVCNGTDIAQLEAAAVVKQEHRSGSPAAAQGPDGV